MAQKRTSGYFCKMVGTVEMCVPYDKYRKHGFIEEEAKSYYEIFGVKK